MVKGEGLIVTQQGTSNCVNLRTGLTRERMNKIGVNVAEKDLYTVRQLIPGLRTVQDVGAGRPYLPPKRILRFSHESVFRTND